VSTNSKRNPSVTNTAPVQVLMARGLPPYLRWRGYRQLVISRFLGKSVRVVRHQRPHPDRPRPRHRQPPDRCLEWPDVASRPIADSGFSAAAASAASEIRVGWYLTTTVPDRDSRVVSTTPSTRWRWSAVRRAFHGQFILGSGSRVVCSRPDGLAFASSLSCVITLCRTPGTHISLARNTPTPPSESSNTESWNIPIFIIKDPTRVESSAFTVSRTTVVAGASVSR